MVPFLMFSKRNHLSLRMSFGHSLMFLLLLIAPSKTKNSWQTASDSLQQILLIFVKVYLFKMLLINKRVIDTKISSKIYLFFYF